jgi:hypothetical protein
MKQKSWHLNRREFLKGAGVALALPYLNAMECMAKAASGTAGKKLPRRFMGTYISYGVYQPDGPEGIPKKNPDGTYQHHEWSWWPCGQPGELTFNKSSEPFRELKDNVTYLRGLDHKGGYGLGGHSSGDVFLTGANMGETETANNISIDQLMAMHHGHHTRHNSLVIGTEGGTGSYLRTKTLSHRGPGKAIPAMHKPQEIFNRLFNPYGDKGVEQVRAGLKRDASLLDLLLEDSKSFHRQLGVEDQHKMDEYLESIREIEKRVERSSMWTQTPLPKLDTKGLNLEVNHKMPHEYIRVMYDLAYLAFLTDQTRFATFMTESENSSDSELWNYANYALGYKGATHDIAHKRPADFSGQWDLWRNENHAYFLKRLASTREGDGTMLDNTLVFYGSAHPHGSHSDKNYPLQLAGGKNMGFKHGNLHEFVDGKKVPLSNLFVTMLQAMEVPTGKFADSTGTLNQLLRSA